MKKNKMMRIASFLLVAVLMSTCAISGTFAKYVTADSATDDARVAKWGITVAVSGNLFGKAYESKNAQSNQDSIVASSTNVSASTTVVAPGTKNDVGMNIAISGTPEVAYSITAATSGDQKDIFLAAGTYGVMVEAEGLNAATDIRGYYTESGGTYTAATGTWSDQTTYYQLIDTATVAEGGYRPIVWTLTDNKAQSNQTTTYTTVADLFAKIDDINATKNANAQVDIDYTITWAWAFENQNDGADTILGHLQAGGVNVVKLGANGTYAAPTASDSCLTVAFGISVTVTQVD